ncbi:hypothetical protein HMPREF0077_1516 [Anaerococcus tetradius ATCC 35098]|uniref:Uncharacterized protein n=2 Tax=Anaerococcus tetradius TaxID=33036 RepID=C2CJ56_9FIRM|nr:hypothetical protein HMPREF0077_1516 [Anaerococcus tetradius ATCC 35098]
MVRYGCQTPSQSVILDYEKTLGQEAIDTTFRAALAKETVDGEGKGARLYPELRWGSNPDCLNGVNLDVNGTVANGGTTKAYLGDFANMFKWGYAKQIPLEVIKYGDPDNSSKDLKGYNQVYLRARNLLIRKK